MRKLAVLLLIGAGPALAPEAAAAQSSVTGPDPITVTGENRVVCRRVTRTATRMRVGRICRPLTEWRGRRPVPAREDSNGTIDDAADTLDALGADDIGTNDQKDPMDRTPDTPLGPR